MAAIADRMRWLGLQLDQRLVGDSALELTAGREDVPSARPADERRDAGLDEDLLEGADAVRIGCAEIDARAGIECYEVYLGAQSAQQCGELAGVSDVIVHAVEQDVLKRDALAVP